MKREIINTKASNCFIMADDILKSRIERLKESIEQTSKHAETGHGCERQSGGRQPGQLKGLKNAIDAHHSFPNFRDYKSKKAVYYISSVESGYNELKKALFDTVSEARGQDAALDLVLLWKDLQKSRDDAKRSAKILDDMASLSSKIIVTRKRPEGISLKAPKMPAEIKEEVIADIREIEKCFNSGLYRSATILCGRVLETALHRRYYDATGNDLLEKSPGIGLGNLIAKMKEKNIEIDPAITQQIHLVNQVRIFTVHKKKEPFIPSREQVHAIILYTMDVIGRMF